MKKAFMRALAAVCITVAGVTLVSYLLLFTDRRRVACL